jgi:hypothetical protein
MSSSERPPSVWIVLSQPDDRPIATVSFNLLKTTVTVRGAPIRGTAHGETMGPSEDADIDNFIQQLENAVRSTHEQVSAPDGKSSAVCAQFTPVDVAVSNSSDYPVNSTLYRIVEGLVRTINTEWQAIREAAQTS